MVLSDRMKIKPNAVIYSITMKIRPRGKVNSWAPGKVYSIRMKITAKSIVYTLRRKLDQNP